ncbi:MAG: ABC transporter permease subunit [Deltaproteobacteria bacterium]|jgi:ABC-2 type transport system permease protein|nr:ABC transporter permease subunit [Deltaproteobacteria bacterium]MBT6434639.1 ABC transporter permease subunit [Deltaproteobacteria bacterium]
MSLVRWVAHKEIKEIIRDGRLRLLGGLVIILAMAALAFGAQQTIKAQEAREHARERAAKQWEDQGDKNPHVAAHYGTHVFAPTSVVTAMDPGVSAYLGRSVKIEAHKRNLAAHSAAQDSASLQRMGNFSVATVLLQLVPLLIIALGHGLWSRERESGTLRQLLSTGVNRKTLFWGKSIALGTVISALLIPAGAILVGCLWMLGAGDGSTVLRLGLLALGYGTYFSIFGGLTLYASAAAPSSRAALVAMIGIWGLFCLVMPRAATEFAGAVQPLPSQAELARNVSESLEKGVDGKMERETAIEAIISDLMAEQKLSNTGMLVMGSQISGLELQAEARWEDMIYDHHMESLDDNINAQEQAVGLAGMLSPFVAMRTLSAGLAGTDFAHHRHFTDHAETWRKKLVAQLNKDFAENAGDEGWEYRAGPDLWKKVPPFTYETPSMLFALRTHATSVFILLAWLTGALVLALRSAQRVRVV